MTQSKEAARLQFEVLTEMEEAAQLPVSLPHLHNSICVRAPKVISLFNKKGQRH